MTRRLVSKTVMLMMACGLLMVTRLPITHGYDAKATATPDAPSTEATAEATSETPMATYENPYADIPFSRTEDGAPVLGNPDAPITIIEFADFACPYCQRYEPTMQQFIKEFVVTGRAKYEFRVFPTAGGRMTVFVGSIASCFEDQQAGVFWPLHDLLYAHAEAEIYNEDMLKAMATVFNLNFEDALTCIGDRGKALQVETDVQLGHSLGVGGTPAIRVRYKGHNDEQAQSLIVDGQSHDQGGPPLSVLKQAVEDAEAGNIPTPEGTPAVPILPGDPI